jgi:ABC-type spermidine/putrescine transport system permease subunit I
MKRSSRIARYVPALLMLPCLAWAFFFFLLPIGIMVGRSFEVGGVQTYINLLHSPVFRKVISTTLQTAVLTTIITLIVAYPVAYLLTTCGPRVRAILLVCILVPFWVDMIVRSFSWLIMLGDNGIVNKILIALSITSKPLPILYNSFSVLVAMVQILLPLAVVTLFGAMLRIDTRMTAAAKIHGASDWQAFRAVFFPLSLPGIYGAALLLFVLALGFYMTPALLGSPNETMIAQTIVAEATQMLDFDRASAEGALLVILALVITIIYNSYFSLDRLWGGVRR